MLGKQRINEIEEEARKVLTDHLGDPSELEPPIDISSILQKQNLKLFTGKFEDPTISGTYQKADKAIYVSADDSKTRQLFTVAHELGHVFLEPNKKTDVFYRHQLNEFNNNNGSEQEANWFAASLLMPKELVEKKWKEEKNPDLIAAIFGVSPSAALWRLKNLGLK